MEVLPPEENIKKLADLTKIVYILQALSFLFGITMLAAVVINYVKRDEVRGTYLESHFNWQIKTFWIMLIGGIIGFVTTIILIGFIILFVLCIWFIIRIVKGWLTLNDGKALA